MLRVFISFIILILSTEAALERRHFYPIPQELSHKQGCYIPEVNDVIPKGESVSPVGICHRIACQEDSLVYATCSPTFVKDQSKCYTTEMDYSRPYPECCPMIQCDLEASVPEE